MTDATRREIDFSTFLLYRLAEHWGLSVPDAYRILAQTGAFEDYVIPYYDVLHTLGEEYLVEDLTRYVRSRGASI